MRYIDFISLFGKYLLASYYVPYIPLNTEMPN